MGAPDRLRGASIGDLFGDHVRGTLRDFGWLCVSPRAGSQPPVALLGSLGADGDDDEDDEARSRKHMHIPVSHRVKVRALRRPSFCSLQGGAVRVAASEAASSSGRQSAGASGAAPVIRPGIVHRIDKGRVGR